MIKKIITLLLFCNVAYASLINFQPNTPIKSNELNSNFNHIKNLLQLKNILVNFNTFSTGQLILNQNLENEFSKVRNFNIPVTPLDLVQIKASELNTAFTEMELGAMVADDIPLANNGVINLNEDSQFGGILSYINQIGPSNVIITSTATNGNLVLGSNGSYTYNPNLNYNGLDSFSFKVNDGNSDSNIATVSIVINPINDAPILNSLGLILANNVSPYNGQLSVTDIDSSSFTYSITQNPNKGSLTLNPSSGQFTYSPNISSIGTDSFSIKVNDGQLDSVPVSFSINISCGAGYHEEASQCLSDVRSCNITNGVGSQVWNGTSYNSCQVVSCNTGLYPNVDNNACINVSVNLADNQWPYGSDGNLTITSGNTVTIYAGEVKDYNNIDIQTGGTLIIDGSSSKNPVVIGVAGTVNISGTIIGQAIHNGGTFSTTLPRSLGSFSYTVSQSMAGAGGIGGKRNVGDTTSRRGAAGGAGSIGIGGGGGGGGSGSDNNGDGASGGTDGGSGGTGQSGHVGGAGNSTLANGLSATSAVGGTGGGSGGGGAGSAAGGGGGGGGYKGKHGLALYLFARNKITGSGQINLSGQNGFNGGNGRTSTSGGGGGGGGGGAGGSGGKVYIRHGGSIGPSVLVNGGNGGAAGLAGGTVSGGLTAGNGSAGSAGANGSSQIVYP